MEYYYTTSTPKHIFPREFRGSFEGVQVQLTRADGASAVSSVLAVLLQCFTKTQVSINLFILTRINVLLHYNSASTSFQDSFGRIALE